MTGLMSVRDQALALYWRVPTATAEDDIERQCLGFLIHDAVRLEMGWPPIAKIHRQFTLGRARADIVIEHTDRSVTIIEVKSGGRSLRDYCTGIGQLAYHAVMAHSYFQTTKVRRVLALPGPVPVDVALACFAVDVDIFPTATAEQWEAILSQETAKAAGEVSNVH